MNVERLTPHETMNLMGSEATESEAHEMLLLIRESGAEDTKDISMDHWILMMDMAIQKASNPN